MTDTTPQDSAPELRDSQRLATLQALDLMDTAPEPAFERLTELTARVLRVPLALINLLDERRQFSKSCFAPASWPPDREASLSDSFCKFVVISREPVLIEDARRDTRVAASRLVTELGVVAYLGVPLTTSNGQVIGSLCASDFRPREWSADDVEILSQLAESVSTEITLRVQLREMDRTQAELRAARAEAERANRAKSDFLSRMSHELRTPLNAILGFGQILEMDVEKEEDRDSVEQIILAGRHLLALIDEVLDLAKIEAGRMSLSLGPVSLQEVLDEAISMMRPVAAQYEITVSRDAACHHQIRADRQRLRQVLLNLLSNAIKYNRPGGTVRVHCALPSADRLRVAVADTGPGIPAAQRSRLFTPFERLEVEHTGIQGTGLGLTLTKGLVEAMEGEIGVESEEGGGSTFWVELPRAASG